MYVSHGGDTKPPTLLCNWDTFQNILSHIQYQDKIDYNTKKISTKLS